MSKIPLAGRPVLLLVLATLAWGCASAEGAYTDGMELETAGDYAAAADAYATALERDRTLPNVAGRLRVAGREAVRRDLARASTAEPVAAAQAYRRARALLDRAAAVGVEVERPATFAADHDAALAAAVEALYADAEAAYDRGAYLEAAADADRARGFSPAPDWAEALGALRVDAFSAQAEADLAAGRYRAALGHLATARATGPDAGRLDAIEALTAAVLEAGAVVGAVFPIEGDDADGPFARDLYDVLVEDELAGADPLVRVVDPAAVRRWDRERGRLEPDLSDSPRRLGDATRDLEADAGAVVVLGPVSEREVSGEASTRRARLRGGSREVTYTVREVDVRLEVEADVVVADRSGRTVCDRTARARAEADYDRASYDGDWRELELSRREREAFLDDAADRARLEALDALRDRLAADAAGEVRRCLAAQVR